MSAILGISAFYHDSAAALLLDGQLVAAIEEERLSRKKHDDAFPARAIAACLERAGIGIEDVELVAFYEKPLLKLERILETYLAVSPDGLSSFLRAIPIWVRGKMNPTRQLSQALPGYRKRFVYLEHHESHAASAYFPSPFEHAAILTLDGVGEWATATLGEGRDARIRLTHELRFPHSPGLFYSAFTYFTGFRVNSGEYKMMGLAPYGTPRYVELLRERVIDVKDDGSFRLDMSYFRYCQGLTMTSRKLDQLLGGPPRAPEAPITERELDIAASVQAIIEDVMLRCARRAHELTGARDLCLAGGVALNCVGNGRILAEGPFERVWVQPASGDAGGAVGAAFFTWHELLGHSRTPSPGDAMRGARLGPSYDAERVRAVLHREGAVFRSFDDEALVRHVAAELARGRVVAWFDGAMEFGPRALGGRSVLADARRPDIQRIVNEKVKIRETFRPFAPAVLRERANEWFDLEGHESPYMLLVAPVASDKRVAPLSSARGLERVDEVRSRIPAVTHVDCSARVQTVDHERSGRFRRLLEAFEALTGCPILLNTSFNVRGEPIVCSPEDAWRCFLSTDIDLLVMGDCVIDKTAQPAAVRAARPARPAAFAPD